MEINQRINPQYWALIGIKANTWFVKWSNLVMSNFTLFLLGHFLKANADHRRVEVNLFRNYLSYPEPVSEKSNFIFFVIFITNVFKYKFYYLLYILIFAAKAPLIRFLMHVHQFLIFFLWLTERWNLSQQVPG